MAYVKTKQLVPFTQGAAVTLANSTVETTLLSTTFTGGLEFSDFLVGKTFRVSGFGHYTNTGTPTLQLKLKFGSVVLSDSTAITTTTGATNRVFKYEALVTVYALGTTGTLETTGVFSEVGSAVTGLASTAATVNTTVPQTLALTAQWSAASASNTITLNSLVCEELN